jgi:hypothetical protein
MCGCSHSAKKVGAWLFVDTVIANQGYAEGSQLQAGSWACFGVCVWGWGGWGGVGGRCCLAGRSIVTLVKAGHLDEGHAAVAAAVLHYC